METLGPISWLTHMEFVTVKALKTLLTDTDMTDVKMKQDENVVKPPTTLEEFLECLGLVSFTH